MKPAWGKIIAAAIILGALAAAWRYTPLAEALEPHHIAAWTRSMRGNWWAPFALLAAYTIGSCLLFPRPLLTLASVVTFGVGLGLLYGVFGVLVAALVTYAAGRLLPPKVVHRIAGDKLDAAAKKAKHHGVLTVFAANMTPVPPFVVQNVIAGALRIPLWHFLLGTFLGCLPGVIGWTLFGRELNTLLEQQDEISYWLMGAGVAFFVVSIFFIRRWLRRYPGL